MHGHVLANDRNIVCRTAVDTPDALPHGSLNLRPDNLLLLPPMPLPRRRPRATAYSAYDKRKHENLPYGRSAEIKAKLSS